MIDYFLYMIFQIVSRLVILFYFFIIFSYIYCFINLDLSLIFDSTLVYLFEQISFY